MVSGRSGASNLKHQTHVPDRVIRLVAPPNDEGVMSNLLIENGTVLTMDDQDTVYAPGWVWVEHDRIDQFGFGQAPVGLVYKINTLYGINEGLLHLTR